jgi:hypothetical protein
MSNNEQLQRQHRQYRLRSLVRQLFHLNLLRRVWFLQ